MAFKLPPLPWPKDALKPFISEETINYHYGKHHQGYVNKLNKLIEGNEELQKMTLEQIITSRKEPDAIFNNAAQTWNHTFFWNSMKPGGDNDSKPTGRLALKIDRDFGSFETFKNKFIEEGVNHFASGWVWLVRDQENHLEVVSTHDAGNPMTFGKIPVLTCDLWEHAYYLDYKNERAEFLKNFFKLINWDFAEANLKQEAH